MSGAPIRRQPSEVKTQIQMGRMTYVNEGKDWNFATTKPRNARLPASHLMLQEAGRLPYSFQKEHCHGSTLTSDFCLQNCETEL
jgi:hypothetical protein